jgi:hypothetical protein
MQMVRPLHLLIYNGLYNNLDGPDSALRYISLWLYNLDDLDTALP